MMTASDEEVSVARAVISPKFQIVIPKEIRERLDLRPGQQVALIEREGHITIVPQRPISELRGLLKGADTTGYRDKTDRF
jgi:AbrB family looped-hinge helix DNA binding protein